MAQPASLHVVVIGAGLAGYGVLRELRRLAPDARLTLIAADDGHFYSKPALSTALAKGKTAKSLVTIPAAKMAASLNLDIRSGRIVEAIIADQQVILTTGGPLAYDKLVIAMGAHPIRAAIDGDGALRAVSVNHLDHYADFRQRLPAGGRVLIIGAGLVGTEFANDLASSGYAPIVVDMLGAPLAQLVPPEAGDAIRAALSAKGVAWHFGRRVGAIHRNGAASRAVLDDGTVIDCDAVLSAVGLRPNTALARDAGLTVADAIIVDSTGRTSDPHIFAIGDCAQYPSGVAAYVTPIMAAARAIAPSVLGTPTAIDFPPLSVQVKTTLCPMVLLPVRAGTPGAWATVESDETGAKYLFRNSDGTMLGYVLTHDKCASRVDLDREIAAQAAYKEAA
ncbi:NAD(P)/FAD-dependent oxidoreductase [Sphingomonas sp. 28-63-12]|uniref:NAD(P)/FAD-dependent oxidoreductase n=1 Tax=Sphingomonas sp. 28-63-12 TaxID=1970434 RepID=UPI000BC872F4|nr:MAG: pyridine nucleotide-disulfide oxidoreductase [Sphingomonas sp. 28-63-12]